MIRFKSVLVGILLCCLSTLAQTKNEKEFRVSLSEFPEASQHVIRSISEEVKRIRYYKEIDGDHESYESKFKYKRHWFSVEFGKNGIIEDIEVTVREKQIDNAIRAKIKSYLSSQYSKHDFIKLQEQYIPSKNESSEQFLKHVLKSRTATASNYEIVVAVKADKNWIILEMTFDPEGTFIGQRTIKQDSYEYIMY